LPARQVSTVKSIEYRQLANILSLFLIVQLAGALIAFNFMSPVQVSVTASAGSASEILFYFAYIVVAAIIMMFLFRIYHGNALFTIIEAVVVVSASFYLFIILLSPYLPQAGGAYAILLSLALAVALIIAKNKWPRLRNLTAVVASIGVGVVLGSYFSFFAAYALMAFIAIYDYVAVFVTKHMIALGRESVNRNLAFMIGAYDVEVVPKGYLKGKELKGIRKAASASKANPLLKRLVKEGSYPVPSFSALGTGDLAIPLMLAVSAFGSYLSYFMCVLIIVGSAFGLMFAMYISKRYRVALPAIPPLFAFATVAIAPVASSFGTAGLELYALMLAVSVATLGLMLISARKEGARGSASSRLVRG
jgi:presenilin-like A22 family membrane protease